MKLVPLFQRLHSGEHNSRIIRIELDEDCSDKTVRLGFITPMGKIHITEALSVAEGVCEYPVPNILLDGRGLLLAQLLICEGEEYVLKSAVEEYPVYASVDDMCCPEVSDEALKSLAMIFDEIIKKSDIGHSHDDRYYTENEVNELLEDITPKEHNHDDRYYTENEVDELLEDTSPKEHNHDDRYYTEGETDELLSQRAEKNHRHNDLYYQKYESDVLLVNKSDVGHDHDSRYYSREDTDAMLSNKSNFDHNHRLRLMENDAGFITANDIFWSDVKWKPGDIGPVELGEISSVPGMSINDGGCYVCAVNSLAFRIDDAYRMDAQVTFADTEMTYEIAADTEKYGDISVARFNTDSSAAFVCGGLATPVKNNEQLPAFMLLCDHISGRYELYSPESLEGAKIVLKKTAYIKLSEKAFFVTDEVKASCTDMVTSGAVYNAMKNITSGPFYVRAILTDGEITELSHSYSQMKQAFEAGSELKMLLEAHTLFGENEYISFPACFCKALSSDTFIFSFELNIPDGGLVFCDVTVDNADYSSVHIRDYGKNYWNEIVNKPGDVRTNEYYLDFNSVPEYDSVNDIGFCVPFEHNGVPSIPTGAMLFCELTSYFSPVNNFGMFTYYPDATAPEDSKVLLINTGAASYEEFLSNGFPESSNLPSLAVIFNSDGTGLLITKEDYTGYRLSVSKFVSGTNYYKLPNEALEIDEAPSEGSERPVSSGGVFAALKDTGKPFPVRAVFDFENMCLYELSVSFEEIEQAYKRGDFVYLELDISQLIDGQRVFVEPASFLSGNYAVFERIISMDANTSVQFSGYIMADGTSTVMMNELVRQTDISGLSFAVSDTVPTVDDRSVITFVVEE